MTSCFASLCNIFRRGQMWCQNFDVHIKILKCITISLWRYLSLKNLRNKKDVIPNWMVVSFLFNNVYGDFFFLLWPFVQCSLPSAEINEFLFFTSMYLLLFYFRFILMTFVPHETELCNISMPKSVCFDLIPVVFLKFPMHLFINMSAIFFKKFNYRIILVMKCQQYF